MSTSGKKLYIAFLIVIFLIVLAGIFLNNSEKESNNTADETLSQNSYNTSSPVDPPTLSPSPSQEDIENSSYPEVSYKDIKSGKYDESYVIITGILDFFEYRYSNILQKESCSFDLWIKDGDKYFKDYNWDILNCNESNLTALKSAKSGNKIKLCVYIYEGSTFGSADVIGGGVVDDKDHRKSIKKNVIKNCKSMSYKNLLRHPERYMDKLVKVSGKILQIAEESDTETEFLLIDDGNTYYINYKHPKSDYHLLEDDKISVYGASYKTHTYNNLLGSKKTVPELNAYYVK